ncbi:MAG: UDP-N-acetylmuramate--L-alanine ligase [Tissierellia bacterium]|nr:UDP-N-acetylmuramate--L-alanine ligase [Tissierellia bacterium]
MFKFDLDNHDIKNIHFIGIGGVSMSGIAHLLLDSGFNISGSDREVNPHTKKLEELGVKVKYGQKAENIENPDIIVYTDAILPDNEELIYAKTLDIPVVTRGVFLGALMRNYKHSIAISGSHGKSTVTSMISTILVNSKYNPSILLGGDLDTIEGNVLVGDRDYLITEACEYKANILNYYPSTVIVLNISEDHLDYYKNLDHIVSTFIGYMKNLDENSNAIINIDDPNCIPLLDHIKGKIYTFGLRNKDADFRIENVKHDEIGKPSFTLVSKEGDEMDISLPVIGDFNMYNAAAAAISMIVTGVDKELIIKQLHDYRALHRRMELVGQYNGANIMTDYGHHPTEIKNTLHALSEHKKNRLICVFQPHTFSRTKSLLKEFSEAFDDVDEVIVTDIYAAREHFDSSIHSNDIVKLLLNKGINAKYLATFEEAKEYIYNTVEPEDLVLTTGCGIPHLLAYMIVNNQDFEHASPLP